MESELEWSVMEGADWSLKKFFSFTFYDQRCHKIYNVMKEDFILDRRNSRVADASGVIGKSCAGDRVRFLCGSNLTQVANGPPLLRR